MKKNVILKVIIVLGLIAILVYCGSNSNKKDIDEY